VEEKETERGAYCSPRSSLSRTPREQKSYRRVRRCRFGEGIKWGQRGGREVRLVPCRGAGRGGLAKEDAIKTGCVATVLLCSSVDLGHGGAGRMERRGFISALQKQDREQGEGWWRQRLTYGRARERQKVVCLFHYKNQSFPNFFHATFLRNHNLSWIIGVIWNLNFHITLKESLVVAN
jgi:hypothetical protein